MFKKILPVVLICSIATVGVSCGKVENVKDTDAKVESEVSVTKKANFLPSDLIDKIESESIIRMPRRFESTELTEIYGVNFDLFEEVVAIKTGISPGVGFAISAKMKQGMETEAFANVLEALAVEQGKAFYPDEKEAVENPLIIRQDDTVSVMVVHADFVKQVETIHNELAQ